MLMTGGAEAVKTPPAPPRHVYRGQAPALVSRKRTLRPPARRTSRTTKDPHDNDPSDARARRGAPGCASAVTDLPRPAGDAGRSVPGRRLDRLAVAAARPE